MAEAEADPRQAQDWLNQAARLLLQPDQGSSASRLRRAREALIQAQQLGTSPASIEALGQGSGLHALAQALALAGLNQAADHCQQLARASLPAGPAAEMTLDALNRWVYPRSLRRYQRDILEGRPVVLELEGGTHQLQHCRADTYRNHLLLLRSQDQSLWWMVSGECAEGYPLLPQPLRAAAAADDRPGAGEGAGQAALVRAGNANFAHFLWNELDPLLRLLASGHSLELLQDSDTVLDLGQLEGITRVEPEQLNQRSSVRLGSTLVSEQARATVVQALAREAPQPLPPERPQPLILLGVRGPGRRELRNEVAYFQGLIAALTQQFQRPLILLDGFTYQHNNQRQLEAQQREQACTARVREIIEACPQAQLESLSGLGFAAWLQRSEGLRFYVSHEGTMQHKLGWLRPQIPGLCLVGSPHARAIATWHRRQCEGAGLLFTLPTDLYAQDPTTATTADAELHNQPFQITSIERAIALSMDLIRSQLEIPISSDSATA